MLKAISGLVKQTILFSGGSTLITNWNFQISSSYGGSGTTITDLDGTNNGSIVGSVPYTNGAPTKYLSLDSTDSNYIKTTTNLNPYLNPANTSTNISVFVWVYPTSNGTIVSEQGIVPDGGWYDSQIEWIGGVPCFAVWPYTIHGGAVITSSISAPLNQWHYVGLTYDGATLRAYVNGLPAGTSSYTRQTPYGAGYGLYYALGYPTLTNMGASKLGANFRLGAFQVWNNAISSSTILNNYNADRSFYGK